MRRAFSIVGSLAFLLLAPGTVAVYVPWLICRWRVQSPFFDEVRWLGVPFIALGVPMLLDSFARFALQGLGTPAPIFPTRHLVITGLYRHVRNPMYVGVASVILGTGVLFGSLRVLLYGACVWLAFHLFVLFYEEPKLRAKFGEDYERFCSEVPRWIPRAKPWHGER